MLIDDSIKVYLERVWIGGWENVSCVLKWCFEKSSGPGFGHLKKCNFLKNSYPDTCFFRVLVLKLKHVFAVAQLKCPTKWDFNTFLNNLIFWYKI